MEFAHIAPTQTPSNNAKLRPNFVVKNIRDTYNNERRRLNDHRHRMVDEDDAEWKYAKVVAVDLKMFRLNATNPDTQYVSLKHDIAIVTFCLHEGCLGSLGYFY